MGRIVLALLLIIPVYSIAGFVKGHFTKRGKYIRAHFRKDLMVKK